MLWAALAAALGTPASAAKINVQAKAKVTKPLVLRSIQNFDLGRIMLGTGSWSGATVRLSLGGVLTCAANVTCFGATQVARYNVSGSNGQTVSIITPDVNLVNQADPTKILKLMIDSPGSVVLSNSGNPGTNFPLGGAITINSTTTPGVYAGTFNVSVDYQ
ncbi:MAG: DUF4402 domain-containing protein [Sphingomonas sp.]|nr:DUF4402 domain-containing protein [Sphingomonas sp.]